MKKVGIYTLPDNAELAGIGFLGCYYYNSAGDIYRVRFVNGVQYFCRLPDVTLIDLIREVSLHAV
ncbi:hypothetical protein [Escherichia coli]|uniref:hypothetical protein n=1 Tax=Escherichia coli TaxID=562 RepID=UPI001BFDD6D4|nr:hypothetical protein [Escherichia coli]